MAPRADLELAPASGGMAMDMAGMDMPGMAMDAAPEWSAGRVLLVFSMWWVMMVAMMLPAAAPVILLYATVSRASLPGQPVATASFLGGYLGVWGLFRARCRARPCSA
jgi:predicted metal-binding membrane protein